MEVRKLIEYFEALPEGMIYQRRGYYKEGVPCCFGAHVAHVLAKETDYADGIEALCELWDCTVQQVVLMLRECGANFHPFGFDEWKVPPAEVLRRMVERYEEPPDKMAVLSLGRG